jgi:hypothetical protein
MENNNLKKLRKIIKEEVRNIMMYESKNYSDMSISQLAYVIRRDWRPVDFAAKPYLDAMFSMESIRDRYGYDSGKSIVAYFLSNASSWKGDVAKQVKAELKKRLKLGR